MRFKVHNRETAPEASQSILEESEKSLGFIPNLYGVFAESPTALQAYTALSEALKQSALSPIEQQVVALAVSTENECSYCVAAHSVIATMVKMPETTLNELRAQDCRNAARSGFRISTMVSPREGPGSVINAGPEIAGPTGTDAVKGVGV